MDSSSILNTKMCYLVRKTWNKIEFGKKQRIKIALAIIYNLPFLKYEIKLRNCNKETAISKFLNRIPMYAMA